MTDSDAGAIAEYSAQGPLLKQCGLQAETIRSDPARWVDLGQVLSTNLGLSDGWNALSEFDRKRVYQYYLPVFFYVEQQLAQHKDGRQHKDLSPRPLVFGISAPQGSGKSTLVEQLVALLKHTGVTAVDVSIDDFYLTFQDQQALAKSNPENDLVQVRGNAGSHDVELGHSTLQQLTSATSESSEVAIPRYDKSQQGGRGDRAPRDSWPVVRGVVDVVLFEGWMLGFRPANDDNEVAAVNPNLATVNQLLRRYVAQWDSFVDAWLVIKVADPKFVYTWRQEAETRMLAKGKRGMTEEQVRDFVNRYMPAYEAYLPSLYASGPSTAKPGHVVVVELDSSRTVVPNQHAAEP
eukprot:CAMPEP_0206147512 /NCGR_PEP_ID=MMETSP1473-20131121/33672_1 /ASSEMBLY_ACC=CAM_ASM_001109 /TAXON_ID=1461547 /ORGANISM="Stichococcus sp, Strain RCC1054" /LENGTH=349 /DNA_ID=CAMNT_0053544469 /DNA_START=280 /DNA_END=1329 /DNA_ORIENTATION=-